METAAALTTRTTMERYLQALQAHADFAPPTLIAMWFAPWRGPARVRKVFENMRAVREAAGLSFEDVADLGAVVEVKAEFFSKDFPAWTALSVTALAFPGQLIEIKATAVVR